MRAVLNIGSCLLLILCFFGIFLCTAQQKFRPPGECASDEREFEKALELVEGRDYSQAAEILKSLIPKAENPEVKNKCRYVAATCYRKLGRWEEAISHYQSVLEEGKFPFADLARLHIATGYRNLRNYEMAIEWYETILRDHPDSFSAVEARYQLGECYFAIKQYETAIDHYAKFIESYPEESRVRMVTYKIGCAYQELGKWSEAYVRYLGLIRQNMKDAIAQSALGKIKLLIGMRAGMPALPITMTIDDRMYYGLALYYARQYKAARQELKKVIEVEHAASLFRDDADSLSAKAAYFIAESYYRERDYSAAIREYRAVVKRYPQSDYDVTSQYQIALCHWKVGREEASNVLLAKFAVIYSESDLADDAEFQIAEHYREKERYKAADAYGKVAAKYPTSSLADDALWNMGWCYIKLKDNSRSEQAFRQLLDEYPDSQLAGSAGFWIGVSCERAEKWQAAVDAYKEVMQNRAWYYSDRAKRRIELLVGARGNRKVRKPESQRAGKPEAGEVEHAASLFRYEKAKIDDSVPAWRNIEGPIPTRARELLDLRIFDDAVGELLMAVEAAVALESAYYNLSVCHQKMGDFSKSWKYAWRLSQLPGMKENGAMPRQLYRMSYPIAYRDAVFSNSEKNKLDPLLVLALMLEESRYNPAAVSWADARGLTQIMPLTGKDIAKRLKIRPFKTEMLHQPELNIKMGTWYLGGLVSRLSDHVQRVLAEGKAPEQGVDYSDIVKILALGAYNGGESRIRRWVEKYGIEDIDEFVESIPIYQTKRYIKKVCDSYEMYKSTYIE